jgi:glutamate synthase (NADPH/NADH) large chain
MASARRLVAMGCIMVRQCHSNTCPVGVCTQDEARRARQVHGTAEKVVNLMTFIAEDVREILASLGFKSLDEAIGRTDLLKQVSARRRPCSTISTCPASRARQTPKPVTYKPTHRNEVPDALDEQILRDAAAFFERGEKMQLDYHVRNTQRAIGTRASSHIVRKYGMDGAARRSSVGDAAKAHAASRSAPSA